MQLSYLFYFFETKLSRYYQYVKNKYFEYLYEHRGINIERIYCWNFDNLQERTLLKDFPNYFAVRQRDYLSLDQIYKNNIYEVHYSFADKNYVFISKLSIFAMPPFNIKFDWNKLNPFTLKSLNKATLSYFKCTDQTSEFIEENVTKLIKQYKGPFGNLDNDSIECYSKICHHLIFLHPDDPEKMFSIHFGLNQDITEQEMKIYNENKPISEGTIILNFFDKTEYIYGDE